MTAPAGEPNGTSPPHSAPRAGIVAVCRRAGGISGRGLLASAGTGALSSLCAIGLLATSGWLITRAATRPPVLTLGVAIGAVQAFALGRGIFRYMQRLSVHGLSLTVLNRLRLRLYDDVEPLVPGGLPPEGSGGILSAFVSDAELVAQGMAQAATAAVDVLASVILGGAVAALIVPRAGLVILGASLAVVLASGLAQRLTAAAAAREAQLRASTAASVVDTLRSARELVAYGREDILEERLSSVARQSASAGMRQAWASGLGRAVAAWLSGAALIGVLALGFEAQRSAHLSGIMLAVVVFVALATFDQVAGLPAVLIDTSAAGAAARRLARLSTQPRPVSEPEVGLVPEGPAGFAALEGATVSSPLGDVLVDGVSLQLSPGRRVALVGPSGAGKSTAVHALLHFVGCRDGRATVGGTDVAAMTREEIARHVGWMSEDTHVFAATLGENLRIGRPEASDEQCRSALDQVGLTPWFEALPDRLATALGSGGRPLSAGEAQRLGLARSLLAGGEVLLLDEPTAHLDRATATTVLAEMLDAVGDRSVLVVSHEPDIADFVDEVVHLDGGAVRSGR